jgi:hypothetical protein
LEQWYLCQINFLVPFLVLLDEPWFFMVVILFYNILGIIIMLKKQQQRVNSLLMAVYPLLFHLCFFVIFLTDSVEVDVVA